MTTNWIGLDRMRLTLDIPQGDQSQDALLKMMSLYACTYFEKQTGRSYEEAWQTEYFDTNEKQQTLLCKDFPITSWAGLTDIDGAIAYDADEFQVKTESGIVQLLDSTFPAGNRKISFSYAAGYTAIPEDILIACQAQAISWYQNIKSRGFKKEKLDALSFEGMGTLEIEFELAVGMYRKIGRS
ncbi:MAG: hypothetical protein GY847_01360 [Proteobacteria bacterium]|nr:hypothetical protein [Pseudomonadota bacterium]